MQDLPEKLDLLGIAEIAELAGCTKPTVSRWRAELKGFPKPVAVLRAGPVFWGPQIIMWLSSRAELQTGRSFKSEMNLKPKKPEATRVRNERKEEPRKIHYNYPQLPIGRTMTEDDLRRLQVPFSNEDMRAAHLRVRAKKFANHIRSDRWAENIPEEDQNWLKDDEFEAYKDVLRGKGLIQRPDFKWEPKA